MNFLIIGLGSMGKRRIRCLTSLGIPPENIYGFDFREDRGKEAIDKYHISVVSSLDKDIWNKVDAVIISTPPDKHLEYMKKSIEYRKPAFVEASVILQGLKEVNEKAKEKGVLIAPSCTMFFHPVIKDIKRIVESREYGKVTNFSYHSGQYLPDWHPWENVKDFYVSKQETGAAREIVPFELTWLVKILGYPKDIKGFFGKTMDVGAHIDDTYAVTIDFGDFYGVLLVDVVSRFATRRLTLNLEYAQIYWDWDAGYLKLYDARKQRWIIYYQPEGKAEVGYNRNIVEEMYIEEIKNFIDAINGKVSFPNTLEEDIEILQLLQKIEEGILP
ncbi:Gfo/Idh/MocA family oxidoreductase [Candidatus Aerophobetes bacterium]|nr:Gfo/Idh/MocA family oxidoreductase [Candidatus Aerophobetes bacterium]